METEFGKALEKLLNEYCADDATETPDYILAQYLLDCIEAFGKANQAREKWMNSDEVAFTPKRLRKGVQ